MNSDEDSQNMLRRIGCHLSWLLPTIVACLYCYWQLQRVRRGELFLFSLPWDRAATAAEVFNARRTVEAYLIPALCTILMLGGGIAFLVFQGQRVDFRRIREWKVLVWLLVAAAAFDFVTTFRFFHHLGVNYELHPGIRLFGYAYGLTTGPALGKLLQVSGILVAALLVKRGARLILSVAILFYVAAGFYNCLQ